VADRVRTLSTLTSVDRLAESEAIGLADYLLAVSDYVRNSGSLTAGQRKSAQIRLSNGLAEALAQEMMAAEPSMRLRPGEHAVAGALRVVQADLSEMHALDGLRLAVEIKPVNLAVGRAIWNRFGDIRTFSVNLHLKFPFAVVGGLLVVPTSESVTSRDGTLSARSTRHLISRAASRLSRAGNRRSEGDAPHLLEAVALVVYEPETGQLDQDLPAPGSGLRWSEFVLDLVQAYRGRFEILVEPEAESAETHDDSLGPI
jgi:hypothetical protein